MTRTKAPSGLQARQHRHAGQWILIDTRTQLIAIGDQQFDGISPKTPMDHIGRFALLPPLQQCVRDGQDRDITAVAKGRRWSVRVRAVRAPVSNVVLAVHACYVPEGRPFPARPLVGAWECEASPPGPDQVMRAHWSCELYRVHGVTHRGANTGAADWECRGWEGPRWLDELIVPADRADTRRTIEHAITSRSDELLSHYFRARSPETGDMHHLRLVGRPWTDDTGDGPPWWWRGITLRALPEHTRGAHRPATGPLLDATLALSRDPLFAVDVPYEHVYLTSARFAELGLAVPTSRHLPAMCHPEDLPLLRGMLAACAANTGGTGKNDAIAVRLATHDGGWRNVTLSGVGVDFSDNGDSPHVLCRIDAASAERE